MQGETMSTISTGTDHLLARVDGHVVTLSFNRPEARNALSDDIYDGFIKALPAIAADSNIRVLMLTGENNAFCAGGDVKGMHARNSNQASGRGSIEDAVARLRYIQSAVSGALRKLPQPVIAAIPGAAAGAGLSIALSADLRIASDNALLVTAFANVGASGDFGMSWFLPRIVGEARAKELMFTSPRLSAAEALDLGIVNKVFPQEKFMDHAMNYCQEMAERAPIALRYIKENINRSMSVTLEAALDAEGSAMPRTMSTADHREAAAAFVEKRQPNFTGQ
jgi:2-(1,2-epoxy-1,2-dihydrophenyl)acetyl-CoA isomerase